MNRDLQRQDWKELAKALQHETDTQKIIDLAHKLDEELRKSGSLKDQQK